MATGSVVKVSGPLVVAEGLQDANMYDVVRVGPQRLIGEIIEMRGDAASIQVYEETSGLGPGAVVETTGAPLSVELGPGMIENIYDGIQRPLEKIMAICGNTIQRGRATTSRPATSSARSRRPPWWSTGSWSPTGWKAPWRRSAPAPLP